MSRKFTKKEKSAAAKKRYETMQGGLRAYNENRKKYAGKKSSGAKSSKKYAEKKASGKKGSKKHSKKKSSGAEGSQKYSAKAIQRRRKVNLMVTRLVTKKGYTEADARYLANRTYDKFDKIERDRARAAAEKSAADLTKNTEARKAALEALIDDFMRRRPPPPPPGGGFAGGASSASAVKSTVKDIEELRDLVAEGAD